ncbi:uncharacterized protein LOC142803256 [Rhipicephalus microplus]|uniref:uncharacterized protein LOC142803256 n=1 Tax=Rhipicephalus microplus TaxID=6941 RepID=UPI003F6B7E8F
MSTYTALLFILGAGTSSARVTGSTPRDCRENDDGWAFMTGNSRMYLIERNFNTDWKNRNVTECVSAITLCKDERTHIFVQNITYHNTSSDVWISFEKKFTARAWGTNSTDYNYYTAPGPGNSTLTYLMLHADSDCMVAKMLYRSSENLRACEIWGYDSYFDRTPSALCCQHFYKIYCDKTKQILYKKDQCSEKEAPTKGKR